MNLLKEKLPWWAKMISKMIIGRLGLTNLFLKLRIFDHGKNDFEREFQVFNKHFLAVKNHIPKNDFVVLELGPGYSFSSAVFVHCFGGKLTYLVDQGDFVNKNHECRRFTALIEFLKNKGIKSRGGINYKYLTDGLQSLKRITSNSIDFIFSNAVIEHIKKNEFVPIMIELKRILKENGVCSHEIDLKDHLEKSLEHLRFSEEFWERDIVYNSGFYTNRFRFSEIIKIFKDLGFKYKLIDLKKFNKLPINNKKINIRFRNLPESDLLISSFQILLFKNEEK
jgi:SAM-dependent methyltransferase